MTRLTAAGLTSVEKQQLLAELPTAEQLLPSFTLEDLKRTHPLRLLGDQSGNLIVQ